MLSQMNLWLERASIVLDALLLLRILGLRLHRTYLFITLVAVLSLFYDAIGLALGPESERYFRVVILSKFLYAIVFPLAIWDVFEEAKPMVDKTRQMAMSRTIGSLIFITLWGLLIAALSAGDDNDQIGYLLRLAVIVWTGSVAAALAFLWVMRRSGKALSWDLPRNTRVWFRYFQLTLVIEAINCLLALVIPSVKSSGSALPAGVEDGFSIALQLADMLLVGWCVWKLRAIEPDVPGDAVNANSA
jgi:uncharacterized Tic20 family protein